jgi:hypothetical protein
VSSDPEVIEGHFWQPGEEVHRFYGRLEYDLEHGVRGHFVDTNLIERAPDGPVQPGAIDVLHGEALGGIPLTLQGFYPAKWRLTGMRGSGDDVIDGVITRLLRGAHVPADEEPRAAIAVAGLKGLREFLIGGIVDGGPLSVPGDDPVGEVLNVDLADGVSLLLSVHRQPTLGRVDRHSEVVASAQWSCDPPISLDDLEEHWIGPLQDLILFATRAQSYLLSLGLHLDPSDPRSSIRVLQRPYPPPREAPDIYALALNLGESEDPARLIRSWFDLRDRVGPVWGLFFAALDRPESLLEDRLLGLLAFAEGYDRVVRKSRPLTKEEEKEAKKAIRKALTDRRVRAVYSGAINHANAWTQRQRLDYLIGRAMESLVGWWEIDTELLSSQLSDTRNWLVHWGTRGTDAVIDSQGMVDLVRSLIVVLYVNILRELGLDEEGAARVIASGWRREQLPLVEPAR